MFSSHKYYHWLYYAKHKRHKFNVFTALFFWLFLSITLPFGLYQTNISYLSLSILLIPVGLFWLLCVYGLEYLFDSVLGFKANEVIAKDFQLLLIKLIAIIHIIFIARGLLCNWICLDLYEYLQIWLAFIFMFGFCYLVFSLYARNLYFQNILQGAHDTNGKFNLKGQGKEEAMIKLEELIYIKADDNYVDLIMIEDNEIKAYALRATLSSVESQLSSYPSFIRIHRSYIINSRFYSSYIKSSHEIYLKADDNIFDLPVSKKYRNNINKLFTRPN